jgi:hypothetical protein
MSAAPQPAAGSGSTLEPELKAFRRLLPTLLKEPGSYAVITGDRLIGTYRSYEEALRAGYGECGIRPFLVKQVEENESVLFFTRDLAPCPR